MHVDALKFDPGYLAVKEIQRFPDESTFRTLLKKLEWKHLIQLISINKELLHRKLKWSLKGSSGLILMTQSAPYCLNENHLLCRWFQKVTRCYPEAVLADKIYRNRKNLAYCKKHNIRLSGPKLGRPSGAILKKVEKAIERMDARMRNAVEGKFGEGKRKYGLGRVYAKLKETAECMISMQFFVMNLEHKLRVLFSQFMKRHFIITDIGLFA
ncbi:transposase family protein [Desulfosporosinus orientis DSM 765]|uniref:Transposase family protein n=1 Tax=Desulfosporosinus orientis (strain ATCC 19365 / DSM 765 / NCIMB 8382 / VKM B-1628 / Singapore I) TaxID=768706 RepID=G7WAP0_DESOD|nr:transposase family protein [Desulfosporosinus orientis DSM 765]